MSKTFVGEWKIRFNPQGIKGLKLGYKGAKSYFKAQLKIWSFKVVSGARVLGFIWARILFNWKIWCAF